MSRASVWGLVGIAAFAELLFNGLVLSSERLQHENTLTAGFIVVIAWVAAGVAADGQVRGNAATASSLLKWPLFLALAGWGVVSGFVMLLAASLSMKMLLGMHAFIGLAAAALTVVMRGAAQHVDKVEAAVSATNDAHADLNKAATLVRTRLARANADQATIQRVRVALDRATTVPRAALANGNADELIAAVREVATLLEAGGDSLTTGLVTLEEAIAMVKGR